jgi:hypothetical protein
MKERSKNNRQDENKNGSKLGSEIDSQQKCTSVLKATPVHFDSLLLRECPRLRRRKPKQQVEAQHHFAWQSL